MWIIWFSETDPLQRFLTLSGIFSYNYLTAQGIGYWSYWNYCPTSGLDLIHAVVTEWDQIPGARLETLWKKFWKSGSCYGSILMAMVLKWWFCVCVGLSVHILFSDVHILLVKWCICLEKCLCQSPSTSMHTVAGMQPLLIYQLPLWWKHPPWKCLHYFLGTLSWTYHDVLNKWKFRTFGDKGKLGKLRDY